MTLCTWYYLRLEWHSSPTVHCSRLNSLHVAHLFNYVTYVASGWRWWERARVACMAGLLMDCSQLWLVPSTSSMPIRIQISHYSLMKAVSNTHVIDELWGESRQMEHLILFLIKHSRSTAPLLHTHTNNTLVERDPNLARDVSRLCAVVREDKPFK